jgi:hypothetical protein
MGEVDTIVQGLCVYQRLKSFGDWISHTQGRVHSFTGKDLDEISAFRSSCRTVSTSMPSSCFADSEMLEFEMSKDPIYAEKKDVVKLIDLVCQRISPSVHFLVWRCPMRIFVGDWNLLGSSASLYLSISNIV